MYSTGACIPLVSTRGIFVALRRSRAIKGEETDIVLEIPWCYWAGRKRMGDSSRLFVNQLLSDLPIS